MPVDTRPVIHSLQRQVNIDSSQRSECIRHNAWWREPWEQRISAARRNMSANSPAFFVRAVHQPGSDIAAVATINLAQ